MKKMSTIKNNEVLTQDRIIINIINTLENGGKRKKREAP